MYIPIYIYMYVRIHCMYVSTLTYCLYCGSRKLLYGTVVGICTLGSLQLALLKLSDLVADHIQWVDNLVISPFSPV